MGVRQLQDSVRVFIPCVKERQGGERGAVAGEIWVVVGDSIETRTAKGVGVIADGAGLSRW